MPQHPRIDIRAELADIVDQLTAQEIPAGLDRDKVALPGVWVTTGGISLDGLNFYTIHALFYIMAADRDAAPVLDDMAQIANAVLVLWGSPDGDLTPATVNRAGGPVPALRVPVDFRCEYVPEPEENP